MLLIGHLGDKQGYVTIIYLVRETLKFEGVTTLNTTYFKQRTNSFHFAGVMLVM